MQKHYLPAVRAYHQSPRIIHAHRKKKKDEEEYCDEEEGSECYSLPSEGDPGYYKPEEGDPGYSDEPEEGDPGYREPEEGDEDYSEPEEGDPGYREPEEGDEDYYEPEESDPGYREPEESDDDEGEEEEPEVPPLQDLPPVIFPPFFNFPYPNTLGQTPEPGSAPGKTIVAQPETPIERNFTGNFQFDDDLVQWYAYSGACPVCIVNMLVGAQPQGTLFPSGDEEPPAHRNCRCKLERVDIYDHAINQQAQGIIFDIGVSK